MTDPIALCRAGRISPQVALARTILDGARRSDIAARLDGAFDPPAKALKALLQQRAHELDRLAAMAGAIDHTATGPDAIGAFRAGFDRAVAAFPEASVAAWSLGDAETLRLASGELAEWLSDHALLTPECDVLVLGCGFGRMAEALAHRVRSVLGIDISPGMIAELRRRHGAVDTLRFEQTDGLGLSLDAASFDVIVAVDSFPYLVLAGVAERHVADAARILRPGGTLAIFNLSYRGIDADRATARRWCATYALQLVCDGDTPFQLWDASVFIMRRAAG